MGTFRSALTIAGSDPSGGAGLECDLKVFQALGVHGQAVATALTVQDSARVHAVAPIDAVSFRHRLDVLFAERPPDVVKVGMLATADLARVVADVLGCLPVEVPVVVDPVLVSTSGHRLLDAQGLAVLRDHILSRADVITPNLAEARALVGENLPVADLPGALLALGVRCAVVTGGDRDESGAARDEVATRSGRFTLTAERFGESPHGTGCAFSSAIAAGLGSGRDLRTALEEAKIFVTEAIRRSVRPVIGVGRLILVFPSGAGSRR